MAMLQVSFVIDEDQLAEAIKSLRHVIDTTEITIRSTEPNGVEHPAPVKTGKAGNRRPPPSPERRKAGGKIAIERMVDMVRSKKEAGMSPTELHQRMADAGFSRPTSYNSAFVAKKEKLIRRRVSDGFYVVTKHGDAEST